MFLKEQIPHTPRHRESVKPLTLGQKNGAKASPWGNYFQISIKNTQNMRQKLKKEKKQYWNANMFRNIKQWNTYGRWFFMDIQNIANHSSFIYKPIHETDDKQVHKYAFNK